MRQRSVAARTSPDTPKPTRRYELDWLRTLVVLGLIPVHTAVIFTPMSDMYIKNAQTSQNMEMFGVFVGAFGMPVLFFVAGAASWFALASRTNARFARERVARLFVPLVFASLVISPIQAYFVTLSNPSFATAIGAPIADPHYLDSYPRFYVQYLREYAYFLGHPSFGGLIAIVGQLWFVLCLFAFSLIAIPLFSYLRRPHGLRWIERLGAFCERPGAIFALAAPLALVDGLAHVVWTGTGAVAEILLYFVCFLYGYAMYADERIVGAMRRQWAPALTAGLALWIIAESWLAEWPPKPYNNSMGSVFFIPLRGIIAWFWIVGLVGVFSRYVNRTSKTLRYLGDAAYPFYILHVAVIVSIGYVVISWEAPLLLKFFFIMFAAFIVLIGVYEALIKHIRVMRTLFGLRNAPRPQKKRHWPRAHDLSEKASHATHWWPSASPP